MRQLIAANWKQNGMPDWAGRVRELHGLVTSRRAEVLICPPHPLVGPLAQMAVGTLVTIGAQDVSASAAGAHTGETGAELLSAVGASYAIVGHSERRAAGEDDATVRAKAERAIAAGLRPIICVGESLGQREDGQAEDTVRAQLDGSLPETGSFDIAYEPIWAIGTGKVAQVSDIAAMHAAIRAHVGGRPRILYGGSVKPGNAAKILAVEDVGGALVGGASLKPDSFAAIVNAAREPGDAGA